MDIFCLISRPNLNTIKLIISHFNGLRKGFKIMYRKLKSMEIWPKFKARNRLGHFGFCWLSRQMVISRSVACTWSLSPQNTKSNFYCCICILELSFLDSLISMMLSPLPPKENTCPEQRQQQAWKKSFSASISYIELR